MRSLSLLLGAAALALGAPAAAQHAHHGHHMPAPKKKAPVKKPAAKKPAPKKPAVKKKAPAAKPAAKASPKKAAAKKAAAKAAPRKPAADPHAGHKMPAAPADPHAGHSMPATSDPHAGHSTPTPAADPHAGHAMPAAPGDPHAGHGMTAAVDPPVAPPPAQAFSGPEHAADLFWDQNSMAQSRRWMRREHGGMTAYRVLFDRMEARLGKGRDGYAFEADAWYGGDIDKLWLKSELGGSRGEKPDEAQVQALWSHAIDPWFDVQTGVRMDFRPSRRAHLALGVQGLAPYWIEVDAAAFLSGKGDITARVEAEHDMRITQRLVLQPRAEIALAAQDVEHEGLGAGLSSVELGARLRFQLRPEFAPYVGISLDQAFGRTRRFRREDGETPSDLRFVAGLRTWF